MKRKQRQIAEGILFTDQYQLTMAQLYFRMGLHETASQFEHFYRSNPDYGTHQAGYCINAGLECLLDWMKESRFGEEEISALRRQTSSRGTPLFAGDFLGWLQESGNFDGVSLRSIPEGRVIHPNVPLTVVRGPLAPAQILETPLLNHLNYSILVATKAARIKLSGKGRPLVDFGLRRAHGRGASSGTRAALIGGADFTSSIGISEVLGLPAKGTHAHSMVQAFMALGQSELQAFRAFAEAYPDDCILLVDTIDTLGSGVPNAIRVFEELRRKGHRPLGIRLDSGDLAYLAVQSARMLDRAGFPDVGIVLSNQLDELTIWQILTQISTEAPQFGLDADRIIDRLIYGVGTRLITSQGQAALGGVYKLTAIQDGGVWRPAIKISESAAKTPNPGNKGVWRLYNGRQKATADLLGLEDENPATLDPITLHNPVEEGVVREIPQKEIGEIEPLLVQILEEGKLVYELPTLERMRRQRDEDLDRLDEGVKRLVNPHTYHVSVTARLWKLKKHLIETLGQNI